MRTVAFAVLVLAISSCLSAQTVTVAPTTTLAAETGNNTSAANSFTTQTNGNAGAGNISKVDSHALLYPGSNTAIYAHFMGWFGPSNHMQVGYTSSDPAVVRAQVSDALSRGMSGFMEDWYGPNNAMPNNTLLVLKAEAETRGGQFVFGVVYDGGALGSCHATVGCDLTQQTISDLTYAYNNFEQSPAYFRLNGRPVVMFFDPDRYGTLNWTLIQSSVPGNPLFIFRQAGGFTHSSTGGSYSWVNIDTTNPNNWAQSYLDNFYATGLNYPAEHTFGVGFKGFNDTLAAWGQNRIMNQQCGQVWLNTWNEIGKYYNASQQLESLQFVTWNDYEEGSELETGIENCVTIAASLSGTSLNWTITGSETTLDHYTVFISTDGQNLMSLGDVATGTHTFDLSSRNLAPGNYTLYVKAVGRPSIVNKMSGAVSYSVSAPNQPPVAALNVTPSSGVAPLLVTASTAGSSDPDGSIASTSIDFGDGTVVAGPNATHTYAASGAYTVRAIVTDNLGATGAATQAVTVRASVAPVVLLSVTPASGVAPVVVSVSTAGSSAPNGSIASTRIDFGDGTSVSAATGSHTYGAAGTYTITATVTDNLGISSSKSASVTVIPAGVTVTNPIAGNGTLNANVHVVGTAASGAGITAMKIYLDYNVVYSTSASSVDTYVAMASGQHNLTVQAWDGAGNIYKNTQIITVVNQAPIARLSVTPANGVAPLAVTASTSGSSDPDGSIASSSINFGDGAIASGSSAAHTYPVSGVYTVTATVTDNVGTSSSVSQTVTVAGVAVSAPVTGGKLPSPVHFVASAFSANPITSMQIYVDSVSVYLVYAAQLDTYVAMNPGTHRVTVQAWDATGAVFKNSFTVSVTGKSASQLRQPASTQF